MRKIAGISAIVALSITTVPFAIAGPGDLEVDEHEPYVTRLLMPIMSSSRGMELFVSKGCVSCHSINGVGGQDAVPLDAHNMDEFMNPFDLAAKMWAMAPYMLAAQEDELGGQIFFTGDELADIIAFLHDDLQQHEFSLENLSEEAQGMLGHGEEGDDAEEEHDEEAQETEDEDDG